MNAEGRGLLVDRLSELLCQLISPLLLDLTLLFLVLLLKQLFLLVDLHHWIDVLNVQSEFEKLQELLPYALEKDLPILVLPLDGDRGGVDWLGRLPMLLGFDGLECASSALRKRGMYRLGHLMHI